ncbi:MAG: MerR family transcriptional regulator [bacterium]
MLLTLKQISQMLGVPESTLRRYRDLCENDVPSVDTGRGLMYPEEAVETFRKIRLLREGKLLDWSDLRAELGRKPVAPEPVGKGVEAGGDDRLPRGVRYIEFQLNSVARQLLSVMEEEMKGRREEIKSVRRALKLISRQNKSYHDELNMNILMLLDKVTEIQSGLAYLQRQSRRGGREV